MKKMKIAFFSDHPLVPSGVGTQAKYLIEGLLATGKYEFLCLGGAIQHPDYRVQNIAPDKYGDAWKVVPVNGYGDKKLVRNILRTEKPDAFFIFTDPRQFIWMWEIEDEIRAHCPLLYWHVWDNDPIPTFNKPYYRSTDHVSALSLKTFGILQQLNCTDYSYIPHAVSAELFKPLPEEQTSQFKKDVFQHFSDRKFIAFWNNRNARRKQPGDVIAAFSQFAKRVGKENVALVMHSQHADPEGQNLIEVAKRYSIEKNVLFSEARVEAAVLNSYYNAADVTINIASNEGFGLGTLESLSSGTPILVQMTGGLQYQAGDWYTGLRDFTDQDKLTDIAKSAWKNRTSKWWGIPVFPASRSCTGSQQIPYIYDDRVSHEDVVDGLVKLYEMGRAERKNLGLKAREWVLKTFNLDDMILAWDRVFTEQIRISQEKLASGKCHNVVSI